MQIQYKPKKNLLQTIFHLEVLQGMALSLRSLFSKPLTRLYPLEMPAPTSGLRGQHALVRDDQSGRSKCVACMRCVTVCPSRCIHIRFHEDAQTGTRRVDSYDIEALRCVYCGFCEEVCPVHALTLTGVFEYAAYDRQAIFFDQERLLANWDRFTEQKGKSVAEENLAAGKRDDPAGGWTIKGQVVGRKYKK